MGWLVFIYLLLVLFTGVPAMIREDFWLGVAGTLAPILSLIAGGGIMAARREPNYPFLGAIILGAIFLGMALYWIHASGWRLLLWGVGVSGVQLCIVGFVVGLLYFRNHSD